MLKIQDTLNKWSPPHQQQVLRGDPDGVREGVVVLVLHELLRVGGPSFDLRKREWSQSPDTSGAQTMNRLSVLASSALSGERCTPGPL